MKSSWVDACLQYAAQPAHLYSGCRKIITGTSLDILDVDNTLKIGDCGFTKSKLTMLKRLYYSEEHATAVSALWDRRLAQDKYGSVGLSTYHHLTKSDPDKKSKRASVMGPCLLGITFTLMKRNEVHIDMFYRTTELFKKFPADLVFLRETILPHFKMPSAPSIKCHFANLTCHPMYFVTLIPNIVADQTRNSKGIANVISELDSLRDADKRFYDWTVKWTARYVCDEFTRGIEKFAQAMRVRKDALERITGKDLSILQTYLRANHPGYRNDYTAPDEEDEDEDLE